MSKHAWSWLHKWNNGATVVQMLSTRRSPLLRKALKKCPLRGGLNLISSHFRPCFFTLFPLFIMEGFPKVKRAISEYSKHFVTSAIFYMKLFQSWHPDGGAVSVCTQDDTDAGVGCTGGISCQRNYVIIPGAQSEAVCKFADATFCYVPPNGMERYCGTLFLPEGQAKDVATAVSQPVISCQRPFRVYLATGSCGIEADTGSNGQSGTNGGPGFNFHYKQLPGGC